MAKKLVIDNIEYLLDDQSRVVRELALKLENTNKELQERTKLYAVLTHAKSSYVKELKREMISGKSGVDIASLFD